MKGKLIVPVSISKDAGPLVCPPDKSVTHRSFLFSLLSKEKSYIRQPLLGQDCLASLEAVRRLGGQVEHKRDDEVEIRGFGVIPIGMKTSPSERLLLDCQNSGTTIRMLSGLLVGQGGYFKMIGDESLSQRPMARVTQPLGEMGAVIRAVGMAPKGVACPPIEIDPATRLHAHSHAMKISSAQVKSALLLAGIFCGETETTRISEPSLSRDHTERMLRCMGVDVRSTIQADGRAECDLNGHFGKCLSPLAITVGGDPSSATFWACAGVMQSRSVTIEQVLLNPSRMGFVQILRRLGALIEVHGLGIEGGEEVGTIVIKPTFSLVAVEVHAAEVPTLIDEVSMLAITSLWAKGTSIFRGVQELRVKESDRLKAIIEFIRDIGGKAWAKDNDLFVEGLGGRPPGPRSDEWFYKTLGDHRLAMAAIITADALQKQIFLDDIDCIRVSYPGFFEHREGLS